MRSAEHARAGVARTLRAAGLAAIAAFLFLPAPLQAGTITNQLGILDLGANGGINPATGRQWEVGDNYRFIFSSSVVYPADITSSDTIATYNSWIQVLADASSLNIGTAQGLTWKALVSTPTVNARDNTDTNPNEDGDGEGIFLLNGTTRVVDDYVEFWNVGGVNASQPPINRDENAGPVNTADPTPYSSYGAAAAWTGTKNDGTANSPLATDASVTFGGAAWGDYNHWINRASADPSTELALMYGLSDPLTMQGDGFVYNHSGNPLSWSAVELVGRLIATNETLDLYVYWSTNDNPNAAAWGADGSASNMLVGSFVNPYSLSVTQQVSSLAKDTTYYYAFMATNGSTNMWSPHLNGSVTTLSASYWDGGTIDIAGNGDGSSDGGPGTWSTNIANWDVGQVPYSAWDNSAGDGIAVLDGSGNTVTVNEPISLARLETLTDNYVIDGAGSLDFAPGGAISNIGNNVTLYCSITGDPYVDVYTRTGNMYLNFAPTNGSMSLGQVRRKTDTRLRLMGSTTNNTVDSIVLAPGGDNRSKVHIEGTATWTVGDILTGDLQVDGGVLRMTGTLTGGNWGFYLDSGGTLHFNNGDVIGVNNKFRFRGGACDNTSGSAITGSTLNHGYYLEKDTMFIGSQGTNSDLHLGTGAVTLNLTTPLRNDVEVTVSHSETTLTIGGVMGDGGSGYGLVKSGAGKLVLMANNTYSGETFANEGILDVREAAGLASCSVIQIGATGTLRLDNADNSGSVWTFGALSGLNPNLLAGSEAGTGSNLIFAENVSGYTDVTAIVPNPDSTAYWDGNNTSANADGGTGVWDNAASNWNDAETGGSTIVWDANSSSNDTAIFAGTGAEVALGSDIYLRKMEVRPINYKIGTDDETHVLRFGGLEPSLTVFENNCWIKAGITGSPEVVFSRGNNQNFYLYPGSVPMTLGVIRRLTDEYLHIGGTNTGNTALGMTTVSDRVKLRKKGSGTWTFNGPVTSGDEILIYDDGKLVLNGLTRGKNTNTLRFDGSASATLAGTGILDNFALIVPSLCTLAPGDPTGVLTVTNNSCTINGTLEINVDGAQNGTLATDPSSFLTISSATLNVNEIKTPGAAVIIATYGTLNGTFATTNMPITWDIDYNYDGLNQIALTPPASGTVLIIR